MTHKYGVDKKQNVITGKTIPQTWNYRLSFPRNRDMTSSIAYQFTWVLVQGRRGHVYVRGKNRTWRTLRFQGFCCSCGNVTTERIETCRSEAVTKPCRQENESPAPNESRNRSEPSTNLSDNSKAEERQGFTRQDERNRTGPENGDARGPVTTISPISVVNGPVGEQASPFPKHQEEQRTFGDGSTRGSTRPPEESRGEEKTGNDTRIASSSLDNVLFDMAPSKGKIQEFINTVYEHAMKERAKQERAKQANETLSGSRDHVGNLSEPRIDSRGDWRINGDRRPADDGSVQANYSQNANSSAKDDRNVGKPETSSPQSLDARSNEGYSTHGSTMSNPKDFAIAKPMKNQWDLTKANGNVVNRTLVEPGKCERSEHFPKREKESAVRSCDAVRSENTFDHTPAILAMQLSRIPEESEFSRRAQKKAPSASGADASSDNGSLATSIGSFVSSSRMSPRSSSVAENVNYAGVTPVIELNDFMSDMITILSNIEASETRSSTGSKDRREFPVARNVSSDVNASAAVNDASGGQGKMENAKISTRIESTAPARILRNPSSSPVGTWKREELSTAVARLADKSSSEMIESRTRGSSLANDIQRFSDERSGGLHERQESRDVRDDSPTKDANVKNGYKFWKPRQKLRKPNVTKFYKDKSAGGKRFGKSLSDHESMSQCASPDFKRDTFPNGLSGLRRKRRFQRHLRRHVRAVKKNESNNSKVSDRHRPIEAFINYVETRPQVHLRRKMPQNRLSGNPMQVILQPSEIFEKAKPVVSDDSFILDNDKKSNVDRRIEDKFERISDVLREDEKAKIIQEAPERAKNEDARTDVAILGGSKDDSFTRATSTIHESSFIQQDKATHDYSGLFGTHEQPLVNDNVFSTIGSTMTSSHDDEIVTISSPEVTRDGRGKFEFHDKKVSDTIIGPFLSPPILRKSKYRISKKFKSNETMSSNFQGIPSFLTQQHPSTSPPPSGGNYSTDYLPEIIGGPSTTLSGSWTGFNQAITSADLPNERSSSQQDDAVRSFEFNNKSSQTIAIPRFDLPVTLILRHNGSLEESELLIGGNQNEEPARSYAKDTLAESFRDATVMPQNERDEMRETKLMNRIVRQHPGYTPTMPGMPIFEEITEPEPLPPEAETTVTQLTTTLATTTIITDKKLRPLLRIRETTLSHPEMHEEISLDETTFAEETEATTTTRPPKRKSHKSRVKAGKAVTVANKTEKKIPKVSCRISMSRKERHPYRSRVHRIIAENRFKLGRRAKDRKKKKRRYESKVAPRSGGSISSSVAEGSFSAADKVTRTRNRRDFIRETSDRASLVFRDYDGADKEKRRSERLAANKSEESADMAEPNGLRPGLEKRLAAGELDHPANRESRRRSCEERARGHNVTLENIAARYNDNGFGAVNDAQRKKNEQDTLEGKPKSFICLMQHANDNAVGKSNEDPSAPEGGRKIISFSIGIAKPTEIALRKDVSGSTYGTIEADRRKTEGGTERRAFGERTATELGRIGPMREIGSANSSGRLAVRTRNDSPSGSAEPATSGTSSRRVKSSGNEGEAYKTSGTVIGGAGSNDDKGEALDGDEETIVRRRKDARRINESPMDARGRSLRVRVGNEYVRRPRGKVHDVIRRMIGKLYRGKSSMVSAETTGIGKIPVMGSEESVVDRSPMDWHRSGRRLLSSAESSYAGNADDEYYEDDENEMADTNDSAGGGSDDKAIARSEELSRYANQSGLHRDRRKLAIGTQRSLGERIDAAGSAMPREKAIAAYDTAIIPDDVQTVSKGIISRLLTFDIYMYIIYTVET